MSHEGGEQDGRIERRLIHAGKRFRFETIIERNPAGAIVERDVVVHPGAVVIVPVMDDGRTVMIRNRRPAIGETLLEFPAGTLEADEPAQTCAARELIEETGYRAATIHPLGWFYTTPGLTDERMHAFLAHGLTHVGQRLEADEQITVEIIPPARVGGGGGGPDGGGGVDWMIRRGELRDAKSIVAWVLAANSGHLDRRAGDET